MPLQQGPEVDVDEAAQQAAVLQSVFGAIRAPAQESNGRSPLEATILAPRIAIVDDEPTNIKVVKRYLTLAGYQRFFTTSESVEAFDLIASSNPDVVLLDVMMPHVSGLDILQRLRHDERFEDLPVIILTAAIDKQTKLDAYRAGATEFLTKPVDSVELETRMKNVLKVKAHQDRLKRQVWDLELEVAVRTVEVVNAHLEAVYCLAKVGEFRDTDTGNHVLRVGAYAEIIARQLGLPPAKIEQIKHAAPLHDIGKVGLPDAILLKPGKLDDAEMATVRQHASCGEHLCTTPKDDPGREFFSHTLMGTQIFARATSPVLRLAATIAQTHHEKWDGTGYPQGLAGEQIPIEGRITAVADVFDALCSKRPYKPAMPLGQALAIIKEGRGSHFDPAVVDAFLAVLEEIVAVQEAYSDTAPRAAN